MLIAFFLTQNVLIAKDLDGLAKELVKHLISTWISQHLS